MSRSLFARGKQPLRAAMLVFASCLMSINASTLLGQAQNTGTISGAVSDRSHAVIPGAVITLTSEDRGNVLTVKSNAQGDYTFNDVVTGNYTLQATAPGFATYISRHVQLDSDTRLRVDATLQAGDVQAQVEVTANSTTVDTQDATVGQVIDNELVENLPIEGNNVVALAALLPGVTDVSAPTTFTDENGGATFSANGSRVNSNLFLFDGLMWNNLYLNTGLNYPNHAALAEVSVQLNNYAAQYGRSAGSIFNVVSKSGTNTIHGEAFFHFHDSATDAADYFLHRVPEQRTEQFGLAIGGPIVRDKLFFLAEYQSLLGYVANLGSAETLTPQEEGYNADGTPYLCTAAVFAGMQCASFAGDAAAGASTQTLIVVPTGASPAPTSFGTDPAAAISELNSTWLALGNTGTSPCVSLLTSTFKTASYFPNAEIPAVCFDPTAQSIIKHGYIPSPTNVQGGSQFLYAPEAEKKPQQEYGGFARIDYNLTARQTMAFRFYRTNNSDKAANGVANNSSTGVPSYELDANSAHLTAGSIGHTVVITQNLVNTATVGYKRYNYIVTPTDPNTLGTLGATYAYPGVPSLPVVNINTRFTLGNSLEAYTRSVNENYEGLDNLSWVKGRHNLQLGEDYLHNQYLNIRDNPGTFNFYGNPGYTNAQASDFILGLIYSESLGNPQRISAIQNAFYQYAQDTFRATARLTLNLGVRYELALPWYQPDGEAATFVRGYQSQVFPNGPPNLAFVGDNGVPRSLINPDFTNVSPRIGIAYDVFGNGKTAIRAGFGTFYDAIPATIVGLTQPYTFRENIQNPAGSLTNPLYNLPAIPAYTGKGDAVFTTLYSVIYPDHNYRNSYTMATNLGIQQQVSKGSVFEIDYIGRFARHLMIPLDQNPSVVDFSCSGNNYTGTAAQLADIYCLSNTQGPTHNYAGRSAFPNFGYGGGGVVDLTSEATANYNALQVSFRQRSYKNLTMLANYTYSRTMDEQSNLTTTASTVQPQNIRYQYAPSDQNTTQIFNMGWRVSLPKLSNAARGVKYAFGDWAYNGIYNARTGHPFTVNFGGDVLGTDEGNGAQRAYLAPGMSATLPSNRHRTAKIAEWFNAPAFSKPAYFTLGNVGRNSIVGPAYINTEMSLTKNMSFSKVRDGMHGQFRVEAFNIFNTVNLGTPRATYSVSAAQASTFGSINSTGTNPSRQIQFGYILYF
jgi:hypothetical protein